MSTGNRPLSPHLQIYKPQITSVLSILHRMTGVGLAVGALMLVYWLNAAAYGPEAFERAQSFLAHWFGRLLLFGWTWAAMPIPMATRMTSHVPCGGGANG